MSTRKELFKILTKAKMSKTTHEQRQGWAALGGKARWAKIAKEDRSDFMKDCCRGKAYGWKWNKAKEKNYGLPQDTTD